MTSKRVETQIQDVTDFGSPDREIPQRKAQRGGKHHSARTWLTFGLQSCGESISGDRDLGLAYAFEPFPHERSTVDPRAKGPLQLAW